MEDENEYKKLPTEDKCVHKLWKARVAGYEEAIKLFNQIDDEKSPEWNKYLGLIKKFVIDSNAVAQEKGLEATLVFIENCGNAGKTVGDVMSGVVAKCIAAPKTKTKDLALQITLMYVEIEKQEIVEEELLKGMEHKNPKIVGACTSALNQALKQFGNKVITIKPMVKKIPVLLTDRDKGVRDEMKALVVEMHRWIGPAIEPHIASLQAVMQQELREAFSNTGTAQPTRYLRSQQGAREVAAERTDGVCDEEDDDVGTGDNPDMDPYDLLDPVEILSKLPKDFYEKLEAKKWQERKEALDSLDNLLKTAPRLEPGDYADLVRALKKVISKDTNVMLVALGGRLLGQVASGLRQRFQPYATACVQAILEKFKEKKTNVVTTLRDAIDAIYPSTNLEAIMEDMLAAFENKNPSIKAESSLFLARALCVTQPAAFNKKLIKAYVGGLLKLLESADPSVRDAAAEALGTATKLVGEKNIAPHIGKVDPLKEQKIKEFAEKAEIKVKLSAPKKDAKSKSAPQAASSRGDSRPAAPAQAKAVKKATGGPKKPAGKKPPGKTQASPPRELLLSQEEVDARAEELFAPDVVTGTYKTQASPPRELLLSQEEVDARAEELFAPGVVTGTYKTQASPPRELLLSQEEVDARAEELFAPDVVTGTYKAQASPPRELLLSQEEVDARAEELFAPDVVTGTYKTQASPPRELLLSQEEVDARAEELFAPDVVTGTYKTQASPPRELLLSQEEVDARAEELFAPDVVTGTYKTQASPPRELLLSQEEVDARAEELFAPDVVTGTYKTQASSPRELLLSQEEVDARAEELFAPDVVTGTYKTQASPPRELLLAQEEVDARAEELFAPDVVTGTYKTQASPPRELLLSQEEVDARAEVLFAPDVVTGTYKTQASPPRELLLSQEEVDARAEELFAPDVVTGTYKTQASPPRELLLSQEEVDARAEELFAPDVVTGLGDGNWKTRLQAAQSFQSTVQGLTTSDASAQVLYRILNKKPGLKDTNVQVLKARLEACKYITESFPVSTTASDCVLQDIVTKLGEASCSALAADCLTALAEGCGLEHILMEGLSFAMDTQKNPKVQSEMFNWMTNAIKEFGFTMSPKTLISHSKKALMATNPNVRTAAVNFLGVLSLYIGPSLINHFDSEKPATKQLISLELDKYANSSPPTPTRQLGSAAKCTLKGSVDDLAEACEDGAGADEEPAVADDARPRTDIAPLITDALVAELNDKNWKVRNEALDKVKAIITNSSPIKSSLGELPAALSSRLVDSNSKLAQSALNICESLAVAMGGKCKNHVRTFFPAYFQALGDSKQWIRAAAVSCIETWCREAGPAAPFEGEMVYDALKGGSPTLRASLLQWLGEHLPNVPLKSFPKDELSVCVPTLFACVEDRAADVRKAAGDCVLPFMLHLGYEAMHKQLDKLKPGSKSAIQAALDKARPSLPVQPLPPAKGKKEDPKGVKTGGAMKKDAEKKATIVAGKGKAPAKPGSASSRGKKDDEDTSPLLPNNNGKNQRIIDDQKLKVLKWNFTTPREEFFELLKDQMRTAGLNKQLVANMFHNDFRYHLKAIESLSDDLLDNGPALMLNLDLVLKWLTLRFFDTNPSVIIKGLEYLSQVFQYLMDSDYTMAEYEASCFIPYLVLKVGDPKDTIRNGVKALFKQICVVYSVTKLFGYLMEGLKSKNARQRAECLECIGHLIETYGSTVMSPTGAVALKELARHIGDRDNAVRSAALNCVASAYFLEGDKVFKMIGQISDKDLSLLEERIKRAGKTRSAESRRSMVVPLSASGRPLVEDEPRRPERAPSPDPDREYEEEEEEIAPAHAPAPPVLVAPVEVKVISGPFGLDPKLIAELDAAVPVLSKPALPELDLKFLDEPIPASTVTQMPRATPRAGTAVRQSTLQMSPPRLPMPSHPLVTPAAASGAQLQDDSLLAVTIHAIASPDLNAAIRALSHISGVLVSGRGAALAAHEERLIAAIASQVQHLRTGGADQRDSLPAYKYLAGALNTFYETGGCGCHVGEAALSGLLGELLRVLGAGGGAGGAGGTGGAAGTGPAAGDAERLARILNNVCVRVLEHSQRTALLCAIVSLLHESIGVQEPNCPRYQDLLLKCFWKTLKMISSWDVHSIDYDAVLYKIHLFYKAYPNSYWKKNPEISDTPYRTVKTLVHTLVKMKGASITNHLTQVPDVNESDLFPYLLKVLKQLKLDDKKENSSDVLNGGNVLASVTPNNAALTQGRLPRGVHEELALILKRIGSKDHNRDALAQLYDLRERHPEVDIWTFMQGSSFYFRNYVERGLREVADQRKMQAMPIYKRDYNTDNIDISNENDEKSHVVFLERLRALQAKAGLKTDSSPSSQPRTPVSDNRALADSINENTLPRAHTHQHQHSIDPQLDLHTGQSLSHKNEAAVDALRAKLQQIKSSSKR